MKSANIQNLKGFMKALDSELKIKNLDLPCKNIFLVMAASYLSHNPPESQKNLIH